jgi:hypothetical protein
VTHQQGKIEGAMTILPSTIEREDHGMSHEAEVKFSTPKANGTGYFSLRATVPRSLLARIDEPPRVSVTGTPNQGFIIEAAKTKSKEPGTYAVNYKQSPRTVVLILPFKSAKLTKVERKIVAVSARIKDGKIHVGGMPLEWIKGESPWIEGAPPVNGKGSTVHRLPARASTGALTLLNGQERADALIDTLRAEGAATGGVTAPQAKPDKSLKFGPDVSDEQLCARLALTLRHAAAMKTELEKRSKLKLRFSRDLHVIVDLE